MERRTYEISWVSLWRILFFVILVSVMFLGLRILLGLFLAIVISSGLEFLINFLERRGLPRSLGVVLVFLSSAFIVVFAVYTVVPLLVVDLNSALAKLAVLSDDPVWRNLVSSRTTQSLSGLVNRVSAQFLSGNSSPLGAFSDIVGGIALGASVIVISFYLSLSRDGVGRFLRAILPADYETMGLQIYERSIRRIGLWFRTQLVLSVAMGALAFIALVILGVKYAVLLAIVTAVFELVPYIGPIVSAAAAFLAALGTSPELALWTLIAFVVIHQIESHVLVPLLVGRTMGLHPIIVIIALLMGAQVGGFLGILIAVPLAVVFQEVLENFSDRKKINRASQLAV